MMKYQLHNAFSNEYRYDMSRYVCVISRVRVYPSRTTVYSTHRRSGMRYFAHNTYATMILLLYYRRNRRFVPIWSPVQCVWTCSKLLH